MPTSEPLLSSVQSRSLFVAWRSPTARFAYGAARNGCAQAAVAWLLERWGRMPEGTGADPVMAVYRRFPPDTPFALLGTTPWGLEEICRRCGLITERWSGQAKASRARLEESLSSGCPTIVLLDTHRLGNGWGLHYVVATSCDSEGVRCTNMLPSRLGDLSEQHLPWDAFLHAWATWAPLPSLRYVGITARP